MSKKKKSFLSTAFILASLIALCQNTSTNMLNTSLSPFANYMWGSKTLGGLLTSFFNVGSIAMAFISGIVIQKIGKRVSLVGSTALYGIATLFFVIFGTQTMSLAARVLQGVAKGVITVATASVVSDVVPKERMNEGMGFYGLGNTFAMAFGPMIALNLIGSDNNYPKMFIVCAAIIFAGCMMSFFLKYSPETKDNSNLTVENVSTTSEYHGIWKFIEKMAILPSFIYTTFFASFACVLVFITVYAQEIIGLTANQISMFYLVGAASMLIIRMFAGKVADKYGELSIVVPGCLSILAMLLILAFVCRSSDSYPYFLLCGCLYGVGNATVMPSLNAIAVVDSPKDRGSIANATFYFMMDFGILFSSSVFGQVIDKADTLLAGYTTTYLCSAGINILAMVMAILFLNRKARRIRREKNGIIS